MASDSEMELPCPLFEGSEKRIEVEFAFGAKAPVDGLRSLTREQLDSLMSQVCASRASHHATHAYAGAYRTWLRTGPCLASMARSFMVRLGAGIREACVCNYGVSTFAIAQT